MNAPTPEQVQGMIAAHQRSLQLQKERQARYYQTHSDQRKAYAKQYYQKRKAETKPANESPEMVGFQPPSASGEQVPT